jgi:hypothetical protein
MKQTWNKKITQDEKKKSSKTKTCREVTQDSKHTGIVRELDRNAGHWVAGIGMKEKRLDNMGKAESP